jgi:hypothetical protein
VAPPACSGLTSFYCTEFASSTGWTLGTEWQIGTATASSGQSNGGPDPSYTPFSGNRVAGVVIGGNAAQTLHDYYYLVSPAFNTATGSSTVTLSYFRWLNSDYTPYMQNVVDVFDGTTWQRVWETAGTAVFDSSWQKQTFDVTSRRNSAMRVRFGFNIANSGVWKVSSWNLAQVRVF